MRNAELLLVEDDERPQVPLAGDLVEIGLEPEGRHYLGTLDGVACYAADIPESGEPAAGAAFHGLRPLWSLVDEELIDAQWFRANALPPIPPRLSIARRLIDDYLERFA